jgi:hypothetical protein
LRQELIPKLEGAELVNCGKGGNEVFFEGGNCSFSGIGLMVMQRNKLDVYLLRTNILSNRGGAFVIHDINAGR